MLCAIALGATAHANESAGITPAAQYLTPPDHKTVRRHFTPWANPTPSQIRVVAHSEAKRWHGPNIIGRIACESSLNPHATNGQYGGLIQAGSYIYGYMWSGAPRDVKLVTYKTVRLPVLELVGTEWQEVDRKRVRVKLIRTGTLPKKPDRFHGFQSIRVGTRAVSGFKTTSWECGL